MDRQLVQHKVESLDQDREKAMNSKAMWCTLRAGAITLIWKLLPGLAPLCVASEFQTVSSQR